jgi:hypothetical protein
VASKKFHSTLRPKIDAQISKIMADTDQLPEGLKYEYLEEPEIFVQDGVAKPPRTRLGGWMRAKAPWIKD